MNYPHCSAEIVADTITQTSWFQHEPILRITTFKVECPRYIWAEVMAHRAMARSAASSRAIPTKTLIDQVRTNPVIPIRFGANQPGMVSGAPLSPTDARFCREAWFSAAQNAAGRAEVLARVGVHKEVVNRILEPYTRIQAVLTFASGRAAPRQFAGLQNLFNQRCHPDAQPEFQDLAVKMRSAFEASTPITDFHHRPFAPREGDPNVLDAISVARCARASYNKAGKLSDPLDDLALFKRLKEAKPPHASPFEHVWHGSMNLRVRLGL